MSSPKMSSPMEVDQQPIHINIARSGQQEEKYNQFKEYLILNHLDLQRENKLLKDELTELTKQLNEKETEEDKYDSRTRYFRSLLTNLNELKNGYKEISKKRNDLVNQTNNNWFILYQVNRKYNIQLILSNILFMLLQYLFQYYKPSHMKLTLYVIVNSSFIYYFITKYMAFDKYIKIHKKERKPLIDKNLKAIKEKETELVKLDESTLSLENWIYEV
jgi:lipopolysaccharide export LptBFGC system permease protein LptF